MRRPVFSWVLSLLLVLAQSGAVLHEIGHLVAGQHTGATLRAQPLNDNATCPTCESFAQVATPASGAAPSLAVRPAGLLPTPDPQYVIVAADVPTPRSRGPPQV
jgi:hypothetical protein